MKKLLFIFLFAFIFIPAVSTVVAADDKNVIKLENPLGSEIVKEDGKDVDKRLDFRILIGKIIGGVMGVVGSITLAVFVAGGFMWLTAAGNAERVKKGTDAMIWAAVGLFVIFSSYAILNLILKGITGQ